MTIEKLQKMQFSFVSLLLLWLVVMCVTQDLSKVQKPLSLKNNEKQYILNKTKEKVILDDVNFKVDFAPKSSIRAEIAERILKEGKVTQSPSEEKYNAHKYQILKKNSTHTQMREGFLAQNPIKDEKAAQILIDDKKNVQQCPISTENVEENPISEEKGAPQYPIRIKKRVQNPIRVKKTEQNPITGENAAPNPVGGGENPHLHPIRDQKEEQNPIKEGENEKQNPIKEGESDNQNPNQELTAKKNEQSKAKVEFNPIVEKKDVQSLENEKVECPSTTVDCFCAPDSEMESIIQVNLKTILVVDEKTGNSKCFAEGDPLVVCENIKCVISPNRNFEILFQRGKKVYLTNHLDNTREEDSPIVNPENQSQEDGAGPVVLDTFLSTFFPVEYTYPRVLDESHSRVPRSVYGSNMCRVPTLANSEVTCWKWPNWQTCKQVCIYGHGLESGGKTIRERSFTCRNTENAWKPHAIRDCEPFMNCKVHLKSPGDLNCVEPTDGPAYCDITCADYDDYHSHGKVTWKCEEKAMKRTKHHLPHCAAFEDSLVRLNPPDY